MTSTNPSPKTVLSLAAVALLMTAAVLAAGPLNPPAGAVAPTAKPLSEVEPRTAVNATNTPGDSNSLFKITQPGSYYLTGNIAGVAGKHGIEITVSGVTLDLNGFDLLGVAGSLDGVSVTVSSLTNIAVTNGSVRNWGVDGVDLAFSAVGSRVDGVRAGNNGAYGITVGYGSIVTNCTASDNHDGINALSGNTISNCTAYRNDGYGIAASVGNTITNNTLRQNGVDGIAVIGSCIVSGNTCSDNGAIGVGAGVIAVSNDNRIEGNTVTGNDYGILLSAGVNGNYVVRNHASGNTTDNYSNPASGNFIGTIVSSSAGMNAASNGLVNISY